MKFQGSQNYVATQDLMLAVNAAITLKRPLLVKGEPGTGKTMPRSQSSGDPRGVPSARIVAVVVTFSVPNPAQNDVWVPYARTSLHCIRHIVSLPGGHLKYMTPH